MNFLFKNILIFISIELRKKIIPYFETKNIRPTIFEIEDDYYNTLEKIKFLNEFAISIYEINKETKNEILKLMKLYPSIKFLFIHNGNVSINETYEIIINGAIDVIDTKNFVPDLILAKVIASFRTEFKKEKNNIITSSDGKTTLNLETLKIIINGKEFKITKKQAAILSILISNEGKTVERFKIASIIYSEKIDKITPQLIDKHIQLIKEHIPPLSSKIKNIWGIGYIYE
ncbi:MAG: winged helix-turn-helix domain-containing protein [Elusimicrobiales bacterium]|nr:winged helix-turn-helix domain-containing protein [Elusimicrobiales bacterium]